VDSNQYWQLRAEIAGAEGRMLANLKDRQADFDRKEGNIEKIKEEVRDFKSLTTAQQAFSQGLRTPVVNAGPGARPVGQVARLPTRTQTPAPSAPLDSSYDINESSINQRDFEVSGISGLRFDESGARNAPGLAGRTLQQSSLAQTPSLGALDLAEPKRERPRQATPAEARAPRSLEDSLASLDRQGIVTGVAKQPPKRGKRPQSNEAEAAAQARDYSDVEVRARLPPRPDESS
jgi:hypothetical protein